MNPFEQAEVLLQEIEEQVLTNAQDAEAFRIKYIGSKGLLKDLFAAMKDIPNERKKEFGQLVNELKQRAESKVNEAKISSAKASTKKSFEDL
ncbi:MAG: phenylalanine--tRNA ligase subunit alpha, partial [Bacteroidetes bacterium]|nr:phenylalanine--tRNA ligase subunit alpha [Bacteroidota bacterium]